MTREEQFELTIRIRVLIRIAIRALKAAGYPTAVLPLLAAPVSVSAGLPCVHRAIERIEQTTPVYPALGGGPRSLAGLALATLRLACQVVGTVPPALAEETIDRLLATLLGAFGDLGPEPWPSVDEERLLAGSIL